MGILEQLMKQGGKPSGVVGRFIGKIMNLQHKAIYRWGLHFLTIKPDSTSLDIGCGGGEAIRCLAQKVPNGKIYGIDHSQEMVNLARKINHALLKSGRVEIRQGSVSALPYSAGMFDIITAFETIQFWPDLIKSLQEIRRVLKPSGTLLIVNRYQRIEDKDSQWAKFLQLHTSEEYRDVLNKAGFIDIVIDETSKAHWIVVSARKSSTEEIQAR
jgi:ubiquinone/menaquinone biosynthesis C-methylase UbiE